MATGGDLPQSETFVQLSCSVCLEIFEDPTSIPCGHTFCSHCLDSAENVSGYFFCPLCRAGYNPRRKKKAFNIQKQIHQSTVFCPYCKRQFPMSSLKSHKVLCTKVTIPSPVSKLQPNCRYLPRSKATSMKNRSTFSCPYCHQPNLDSDGLLKHVNNNHRHHVEPVVCPICASMPWGNANQKSGNFVQHLNLRHKFEYNTYVDFERDEEDVLKQVLAESIEDC